MWVVHWCLAPEASLKDLGLPLWGPGAEVVQLFGSQGFCQHQVLKGADSKGSRKNNALEEYGNQYWPIPFSILAWRTPSLKQKPGRPQSTSSQRVGHNRSDPECIDSRIFLPVAALLQWELSVKVEQLLGLQGPWWSQVCRDMDCLHRRSYGPSASFWASCSWQSESLFLYSSAHSGTRGGPLTGVYSVDWCISHFKEHSGWGPTL